MTSSLTTETQAAQTAYPESVTQLDHIAHDMKAGRFPEQSSIEQFLAERAAQTAETKGGGRYAHVDTARLTELAWISNEGFGDRHEGRGYRNSYTQGDEREAYDAGFCS